MDKRVSIGRNLTNGDNVLVFTCPEGYTASWTLFYCINNTSSAKNITCKWYDASQNDTYYIFDNYQLSAKSYVMFDGGAWVQLHEGDTVTVAAENDANAHCISSFELERMVDDAAY